MSTGIKTIFGTAGAKFATDWLDASLDTLEKHHVDTLDTAQLYDSSEKILGEHSAPKRFTIDTKFGHFNKPELYTHEGVVKSATDSLAQLQTKQVDVYYIHMKDATTPLEETLSGINEVYKKGMFKRFGLSNFHAEDVQRVYELCSKNGYVLPSVYQGNYNAVARRQESLLFPTLRKYGIAFNAYSPLAGGFLTKTKEQVQQGAGRFDPSTPMGKMYSGLYSKPSLLEALAQWEDIAKEAGCSRAELGYRWVKWNSPLAVEHGDGIIIGASGLQQLEQTLVGLEKGPLDKKTVERIDKVWDTIKHEAPLDNING